MFKKIALAGAMISVLAASSCELVASSGEPAAGVAARNNSTAADNFEVARRITFYNGITDNVVMVVEGFCSLGNNDNYPRMSLNCKTGSNSYIRNFIGLSDNVFFVSEQLEGVSVSTFHYRTVFRPQSMLPDFDFQGSTEELFQNQNTNG